VLAIQLPNPVDSTTAVYRWHWFIQLPIQPFKLIGFACIQHCSPPLALVIQQPNPAIQPIGCIPLLMRSFN